MALLDAITVIRRKPHAKGALDLIDAVIPDLGVTVFPRMLLCHLLEPEFEATRVSDPSVDWCGNKRKRPVNDVLKEWGVKQ
jgi:hypothetical protein